MIALNGLRCRITCVQRSRICQASDNKFFLVVESSDPNFDAARTHSFLSDLATHDCGGAELAMTVELPDPEKSFARLLALVAITAGCRIDMHIQPYYRTMAKSDFSVTSAPPACRSRARSPAATFTKTLISTRKIGSNPEVHAVSGDR